MAISNMEYLWQEETKIAPASQRGSIRSGSEGLVRLVARLDVVVEMLLGREGFTACRTRKRPIARVHAIVNRETVFAVVDGLALGAHVLAVFCHARLRVQLGQGLLQIDVRRNTLSNQVQGWYRRIEGGLGCRARERLAPWLSAAPGFRLCRHFLRLFLFIVSLVFLLFALRLLEGGRGIVARGCLLAIGLSISSDFRFGISSLTRTSKKQLDRRGTQRLTLLRSPWIDGRGRVSGRRSARLRWRAASGRLGCDYGFDCVPFHIFC